MHDFTIDAMGEFLRDYRHAPRQPTFEAVVAARDNFRAILFRPKRTRSKPTYRFIEVLGAARVVDGSIPMLKRRDAPPRFDY